MDLGIKKVATSITESNNCFYNIGFLVTSDESATPSETWTATDPVTTDPSFIDESGGNYNLQSASGCVGQGIQHWGTGPRPSGWHGEPKADVDIDIGFQSTWSPMHPKNI